MIPEQRESEDCRTGLHFDCSGCVGCDCHPRPGQPASVWASEPVQTSCRGATFRAEVAPY